MNLEELEALQQELQEKERFLTQKERELELLHQSLQREERRLKDNSLFFEQKMGILQEGFRQLERDRREFEAEKLSFMSQKRADTSTVETDTTLVGGLFAGVNSLLALKKRYKDLMKIYHPDNMCGDVAMVRLVNEEYERLRCEFDYPNIV